MADDILKWDFRKIIVETVDKKLFSLEPYSAYFSIVSRRVAFSLQCIFALGYSDTYLYRKNFGFRSRNKPIYDSWRHIIVDKIAMEYEKNKISGQLKKDPQYMGKIASKCLKDGEILLKFSRKIKKQKNFSSFSDKNLQKLASRFFILSTKFSAHLLIPLSLEKYFEETLSRSIREKIKDEKLAKKYLSALVIPARQNFGSAEQLQILTLAKKYKNQKCIQHKKFQKSLEKYLFSYDSFGTKYGYGTLWTTRDIIKRLNTLVKIDLENKIRAIKALPREQKQKIHEIFKELRADKNFIKLVDDARLFIYIRTYRTDVLNISFANLFPLLEEIAKRNNLTLAEIIECSPSEIMNFEFPSKEKIKARAMKCIVRAQEGKVFYIFGNRAERIMEAIQDKINTPPGNYKGKVEQIKGLSVSKGVVRGYAKIVLDNLSLRKVKKGDILVVFMTTPNFIPAMEKAAAFITDEGGVLCHAAIMAREMRKPCVIGTHIATRILKDGDLVEVDADKGIVKKIL